MRRNNTGCIDIAVDFVTQPVPTMRCERIVAAYGWSPWPPSHPEGGIDAVMVGQAESEPTMEEIVGALRETRRSAGRLAPFTVIDGQAGITRLPDPLPGAERGSVPHRSGGSLGIAELRAAEMERLLTENAHLNSRIMFLLDSMEQERARARDASAEGASAERFVTPVDRDQLAREVRAALKAELGPLLAGLLRVLQAQRGGPVIPPSAIAASAAEPSCRDTPPAVAPADWFTGLVRRLPRPAAGSAPKSRPSSPHTIRQRVARALHALRT